MVDRLIGSSVIAEIKQSLLPAGLRDVQDWTDTQLTFRRRDPVTRWRDIVTLNVISIRLGGTEPREATGAVETSTTGTLKVWAVDVAGDNEVQPDDRFSWDGHLCVVTLVQPVRLGTYITVEFRLLEGN